MFEHTQKPRRQTAIALLTILLLAGFGYGVYLLFAPNHFPMSFVRGPVVSPSEHLIFGPYPVEEELLRLKRMGVVEVVSLLDADSPVEGELVARERELVERLGMRFVNRPVPVSYAVTGGEDVVLDAIKRYIEDTPVPLRYVHCYLGRHRVKLIQQRLGLIPAEGDIIVE